MIFFRDDYLICLLLSAILVVQIIILKKMPPTQADIIKLRKEFRKSDKDNEAYKKILLSRPAVSAYIENTPIEVEVNNYSPIPVEIENTPIPVEIN